VLYTIPTGHNPSGATQSLERRRALYAIAARHDLIVLEDDPYYYLVQAALCRRLCVSALSSPHELMCWLASALRVAG
jgi:DNA-binding transcriptional MocR family regulator